MGSHTCRATLRLYNDEKDHEQVVFICKNVFEGEDRIPKLLTSLAESRRTTPLVIVDSKDSVIAFCNLVRMRQDISRHQLFLLEAVRVAEAARGNGYGTKMVQSALEYTLSQNDSEKVSSVHVFSTTTPCNIAMQKIFAKTQFAVRGHIFLWPSEDAISSAREKSLVQGVVGEDGEKNFDAYKLSNFVPTRANELVGKWRKANTRECVLDAVHRGQEGRARELLPLWYSVGTAEWLLSVFLADKNEQRSIWILERERKPPCIIFIALTGDGGQIQDEFVSATVSDCEGAEAAVAFLIRFRELSFFQVAFDLSITAAILDSSPLLSRLEKSPCLLYESQL